MNALREKVKSTMSPGLRRALRELRMELYVQRRHRAALKRARALRGPLRVNLGSGFQPAAGWINVDLSDGADLTLDLREPLPFDDGTVEAVRSEHFLEHLEYTGGDDAEALRFLRECRRVLVPGGTLDVTVPDAECIVREYAARRTEGFPKYEWWGPRWCDTPLHCVNYVFRQGREHKYAYDEDTLVRVLGRAGFADARRRPFDPAIDAPNHAIGSLSVSARKEA